MISDPLLGLWPLKLIHDFCIHAYNYRTFGADLLPMKIWTKIPNGFFQINKLFTPHRSYIFFKTIFQFSGIFEFNYFIIILFVRDTLYYNIYIIHLSCIYIYTHNIRAWNVHVCFLIRITYMKGEGGRTHTRTHTRTCVEWSYKNSIYSTNVINFGFRILRCI